MRTWILAFSLGVWLGGFAPELPSWRSSLLFLVPLILSIRFPGLRLGGAFCLGTWWLLCWALQHEAAILPADLEGKDVRVAGLVAGLPQTGADGTRFIFVAETLFCPAPEPEACPLPGPDSTRRRLLLNDFGNPALRPGQRWEFTVRLKQPRGFANPGGFDYEAWLFAGRIAATGYVRPGSNSLLLADQAGFNPVTHFDRLRDAFRRRLDGLPLAARGFVEALTIGERYRISDAEWELLTLSGTNHLMVISGLHLGLVAWLFYHLARHGWRCFAVLCLHLPAQRAGAVAGLCGAVLYAGLAGFSLPVQRALVMACCVMSGNLLARQTAPGNHLCLALFIVLLREPLAPQSAGFWLSFLAVALLLLTLFPDARAGSETRGRGIADALKQALRSQFLLFAGMLPAMLVLFQQVTLAAPLVNLAAIPLIGLVVVPLCLLALVASWCLPPAFPFLVSLPDFLLEKFLALLTLLTERAAWLLLELPAVPPWLVAAMALSLAWATWRPGHLSRAVAGLVLAVVFVYPAHRPAEGEFILDILDVGQGLAVIVTTRNHVLVYDTGPAYSPRFNAGSGIVIPALRRTNSRAPDLVIVSHADNDHAGGLRALAERYPAARLLAGEPDAARPIRASACLAGQAWHWDGIDFRLLYPFTPGSPGNNASCVLQVSAGSYRVLLPGDIELEAELALVRRYRDTLAADILVAPHHGSRTSSTPPFVRSVAPAWAVFTTGYLNRFGHPHPEVAARYGRGGTRLLETAASGRVRFVVSRDTGIHAPQAWRETRRRIWSGPWRRYP